MSGVSSEWLRLALQDYDTAKFLYTCRWPRPVEIICFHCEQAVEKLLKWVLVEHGVEPMRTHAVEDLCLRVTDIVPGFKNYLYACASLTPFGVQARYPSSIQLDEDSAAGALDACQKIFMFAKSVWDFDMSDG